jgi:lysyl-tRNA synthetase class 1
VKPTKKYRAPDEMERKALEELLAGLEAAPADASAEDLQNIVYEVGKKHPFPELRAWFKTLYEVLLGQETGPRMGTFIALYGKKETATLIRQALAGKIG